MALRNLAYVTYLDAVIIIVVRFQVSILYNNGDKKPMAIGLLAQMIASQLMNTHFGQLFYISMVSLYTSYANKTIVRHKKC